MHEPSEIFGIDDADDVLGAAGFVVDGDAGMLMINDAGAGGLDEGVAGEGDDFLTRGHDFAHGDLVHFEGAVNEAFLKGWEDAHAAGGGGDELQFFGGVDGGFVGHRDLEEVEDESCGALEEFDGGAGEGHEEEHGAGDGDGEIFGAAQGQGFGDEFAEKYMQVGDEGKAKGDRCKVRVEEGVGQGEGEEQEPALEDFCSDGFADPAEGEGAEGDAELHCGEEAVNVLLEAADGGSTGNPSGDHLVNAGVTDGDEGELGGHKEGVGQDEDGDGNDLEEG